MEINSPRLIYSSRGSCCVPLLTRLAAKTWSEDGREGGFQFRLGQVDGLDHLCIVMACFSGLGYLARDK